MTNDNDSPAPTCYGMVCAALFVLTETPNHIDSEASNVYVSAEYSIGTHYERREQTPLRGLIGVCECSARESRTILSVYISICGDAAARSLMSNLNLNVSTRFAFGSSLRFRCFFLYSSITSNGIHVNAHMC